MIPVVDGVRRTKASHVSESRHRSPLVGQLTRNTHCPQIDGRAPASTDHDEAYDGASRSFDGHAITDEATEL